MSLRPLRIAALLSALLVAACSTTVSNTASPASEATARAQLEQAARAALGKLYLNSKNATELSTNAAGILVFPSVVKAGLLIGGEGGKGVLFSADGAKVLGYYSVAAAEPNPTPSPACSRMPSE